jgi:hypothetical protein
MSSNKIFFIKTNSKLSQLGLGDYIRILSFLPNLSYEKIIWISNKDIFPLIKDIEIIDDFYDIDKIPSNIEALINKNFLLDLYSNGINKLNKLYINNIFDNNVDIKINTFDLLKNLANYFDINDFKIFSFPLKDHKKDIDIFFNWNAPSNWKIKEMPTASWKMLESKIDKSVYKNIVWQNPDDNLDEYIKKILRSKKVISIVGLGNHISSFFGIYTIMLKKEEI